MKQRLDEIVTFCLRYINKRGSSLKVPIKIPRDELCYDDDCLPY